jgi:ribokinase
MSADVVVVGSANVDLIVSVDHLPAPGETVGDGRFARAMGGKGANSAVAAARLGARVALVAALGTDDAGPALRADLAAEGVDCAHVVARDASTGVATITVDRAGENTIVVAPGANALLDGETVERELREAAGPDTIVVMNLEIGDDAVLATARHCARRRLTLLLDPGPARALPDEVLRACACLTPNAGELAALGGGPGAVLARGLRAVVLTLGRDGAELHRDGVPPLRQPPFAVDARDSVGAGDAFIAALAVASHGGAELPEAVRFAAACGALATRRAGARDALPTLAEALALDGAATPTRARRARAR